MKFLVDAQLPPALCRWLRDRGEDATHVSEIEMLAASDAAKQQVTLRLDPDVLAKFRKGGQGWQGRINAALRTTGKLT